MQADEHYPPTITAPPLELTAALEIRDGFDSSLRVPYHLTNAQMRLIIAALRAYREHSPDDYQADRRLALILETAMDSNA